MWMESSNRTLTKWVKEYLRNTTGREYIGVKLSKRARVDFRIQNTGDSSVAVAILGFDLPEFQQVDVKLAIPDPIANKSPNAIVNTTRFNMNNVESGQVSLGYDANGAPVTYAAIGSPVTMNIVSGGWLTGRVAEGLRNANFLVFRTTTQFMGRLIVQLESTADLTVLSNQFYTEP
jgi:hypothetical protein